MSFVETSCQTLRRERQLTVCEAGSGTLEKGGGGEREGQLLIPSQSMWLSRQSAPPCQSELYAPGTRQSEENQVTRAGCLPCLLLFLFSPLFLTMTVFKIKECCFQAECLTKFWRYAA